MDRLTIATSVCNFNPHRVSYFKRYLDHVIQLNDLDKIDFIFFSEPASGEMLQLIPKDLNHEIVSFPFRPNLILMNYLNIYYCFEVLNKKCYLGVDDDITLEKDVYRICKYVYDNTPMDSSVFSLLNRHWILNKNHPIYKDRNLSRLIMSSNIEDFNNLGVLITREFWMVHLKPLWSMVQFWDWTVIEHHEKIEDFRVIFPQISRCSHIGKFGTNYDPDVFESKGFNDNNCMRPNEISPSTYNICTL